MWRALIRFFRRREPHTRSLDQRIAIAVDDRELMRLAVEALRAHRPDLAHVAYWRAVQIDYAEQKLQKALGVLSTILRFAPNDGNAHLTRVHLLEQLGRRRDAAAACREAACLFAAHGDRAHAEWLWSRATQLEPAPLPSIYPPVPIVVGTPSEDLPPPEPEPDMIELDLDAPSDALTECRTTTSFDALPNALVGSEHEMIARGYLSSSIPEAATRAYDQRELTKLLESA